MSPERINHTYIVHVNTCIFSRMTRIYGQTPTVCRHANCNMHLKTSMYVRLCRLYVLVVLIAIGAVSPESWNSVYYIWAHPT